MHPYLVDAVIRQHIQDLHREAAIERLATKSRKQKSHGRKASSMRLQRAPAH
jgi:hypothetical protein